MVFCHSLPFSRDSAGRLAARVRAQGVDLVRGDVQLVAVPVVEHQVIALDVADLALHHAAETGHAVLEVHHVVARFHVVEKGGHRSGPWPGDAMGAVAAGEVALGQHGHFQRRAYETALDRHGHNLHPGTELAHHRSVEALVAQRLGEPSAALVSFSAQTATV